MPHQFLFISVLIIAQNVNLTVTWPRKRVGTVSRAKGECGKRGRSDKTEQAEMMTLGAGFEARSTGKTSQSQFAMEAYHRLS
jgi:hypothetical protein